jgi:hypothetical protein
MLQAAVYVAGALFIAGTVLLVFQNRRSKEAVSAALVMVGGVAASLLTLNAAFRDDRGTVRFTSSLLMQDEGRTPAPVDQARLATLGARPEVVLRLSEAGRIVKEVREVWKQPTISDPTASSSGQLWMFQVINTLRADSADGWHTPRFRAYLFGEARRAAVGGAIKRQQTVVTSEELRAAFPENLVLQNGSGPAFDEWNLPPQSIVERGAGAGLGQDGLTIRNPFVTLRVRTAINGTAISEKSPIIAALGLRTMPYWGETALIEIEWTLEGTRKGHPEMPLYQQWVQNVVEGLRLSFDDEAVWTRLEQEANTPVPPWPGDARVK